MHFVGIVKASLEQVTTETAILRILYGARWSTSLHSACVKFLDNFRQYHLFYPSTGVSTSGRMFPSIGQ